MAYLAEISRRNPTCFLFLVDRSASMEDVFGDGQKRKCDGVVETLNRLLYELAIKCAKEDGIRNYYEVGVIGYGETAIAGGRRCRIWQTESRPLAIAALEAWKHEYPEPYPPTVVDVTEGYSWYAETRRRA